MTNAEKKELKRIVNYLFSKGPNKADTYEAIQTFIDQNFTVQKKTRQTKMQEAKNRERIQQLRNILNARLPMINRWNKVSIEDTGDTFIILWSDPKVKSNTHPFESKECPKSDLDIVIKRNTERLYNEIKTYK